MARFIHILLLLASLTSSESFQTAPSFAITKFGKTTSTMIKATSPADDVTSRRTALTKTIPTILTGTSTAATLLLSSPLSPTTTTAAHAAQSLADQCIAFEKTGVANSSGAPEKHLPKVSITADAVVTVTVPHVMDPTEPHYIQAIWLKEVTSGQVVVVKGFPADDPSPPKLEVTVPRGVGLKPMLQCNKHGLWVGEEFTA